MNPPAWASKKGKARDEEIRDEAERWWNRALHEHAN